MSGGTLMLTVVLRHDQSRNLEQLQGRLDDADWWHGFPPEGCEVVSWVVAMGLGQIVTLSTSNSSVARGACSAPSATRPTTSCRYASG